MHDAKHHQSIFPRIDKPTEDQRRQNGNDILRETTNKHATVATTTTGKSTINGTVLLQTARDADIVMQSITNQFAQEQINPQKTKEGQKKTTS